MCCLHHQGHKIMSTVHLGLTVSFWSWRQLGNYVNVLLAYGQFSVIRCDLIEEQQHKHMFISCILKCWMMVTAQERVVLIVMNYHQRPREFKGTSIHSWVNSLQMLYLQEKTHEGGTSFSEHHLCMIYSIAGIHTILCHICHAYNGILSSSWAWVLCGCTQNQSEVQVSLLGC